jgi:ABC-2 type transport system permease protein
MTVLLSQAIFVPSMLLGGMMMPTSMLPVAAQRAAQLLPASQAMNAFSGLAMGSTTGFDPWVSVIALSLSGLLAFGLALYLFSWDNQNGERRGHPAMALLALAPYMVVIALSL